MVFPPGSGGGAATGLHQKTAANAWNATSEEYCGVLRLTEGYGDLKAQSYRWSLFEKGGSLVAPTTAFSPRLRVGENRLRSLLLDPEEQVFHRDWEGAVASFVGAFRHSVADEVHDQRVVELVGELSLASGRFRQLWARQDVRVLEGGSMTVDHPVVGELYLHRDKLPVDGLLLVLYYADPGSASAERLGMLASLARETSPHP